MGIQRCPLWLSSAEARWTLSFQSWNYQFRLSQRDAWDRRAACRGPRGPVGRKLSDWLTQRTDCSAHLWGAPENGNSSASIWCPKRNHARYLQKGRYANVARFRGKALTMVGGHCERFGEVPKCLQKQAYTAKGVDIPRERYRSEGKSGVRDGDLRRM